MATNLATPEARAKLKQRHVPYWREIMRSRALGYRKGLHKHSWLLRICKRGKYSIKALGQADDRVKADGSTVLSYAQAVTLATAKELRPQDSTRTVADAVRHYLEMREARSRSPSSLKIDTGKLRAALPKLGATPLSELTTAELRRWRDSLVVTSGSDEAKRKSQATANRIWAALRAALNHAYQEGQVQSDDAWRRLKPFRNTDQPRKRFLSVAECKRLLNASPPDFRQLARGALFTGMRYGELCRLVIGDFADKSITVLISKSGRSRRIPLTQEGITFFERLTVGRAPDAIMFVKNGGGRWKVNNQSYWMRFACKAARISPPACFHDLRRSYGSLLINAGMSMGGIATALGHSDQRMTERAYAHLLDSTVRRELQANLPSFGLEPESNVRPIRKG
jgi:integrase